MPPTYNRVRGRPRAPSASPDRDDRRGQLDPRPPGGARAGRDQRCRGARHRRLLRLPLRRARRRARLAGDARDVGRGDDAAPEDAAGRGDHGRRCRRAPAGDDRRAGAPRPAVQARSEPARGGVRVDPRRPDPRAREAGGCAERAHARAARVLRRRDRPAARDRRAGRAVDRARQALLAGAAARRGARGAGADLGGGVRVAVPRGVAGGDRERRRWTPSPRPARRSCSRTGRSPGRRVAPASYAVRTPLALEAPPDRRARRRPRHAVHRRGAAAARVDRPPRRGRAWSTGAR